MSGGTSMRPQALSAHKELLFELNSFEIGFMYGRRRIAKHGPASPPQMILPLLAVLLLPSCGSSLSASFAPCAGVSSPQPMNVTAVALTSTSIDADAGTASLSLAGLANQDVSGGRVSTTIFPFDAPVVDPNYPLADKIYQLYNTYGGENKCVGAVVCSSRTPSFRF